MTRRIPAARWRRKERHRTALHEAGHATALYHHWCQLPEEWRSHLPFWSVDVYSADVGVGRLGQVAVNIDVALRLTPWASLQVDLAGPLVDEGATRSRWLQDPGSWWDPADHEPWPPPHADEIDTSDYRKILDFLAKTGCPGEVLQVAVRETAAILWQHRRLVHEVGRRAERVSYLQVRDLVDLLPELAPAIAAWDAQRAAAREAA